MNELARAHGGAPLRGRLRVTPEDFVVVEELGFAPDRHGEHAFVSIEKTGANTEWVARQLARSLGVAPVAIGYAGLKDRHAVCRQTFSVHLPGRPDPDWTALGIPGVRVLDATRHSRKLKRGAHRGNRFVIRLRDVVGDRVAAAAVLARIAAAGVPNYFGEQRFGRDGDNLRSARALFAGARLDRTQRGFALSAARSHLFNLVLDRRVATSNWNAALDGEVWMLAGSNSIFGPQPFDDMLAARLAAFDVDPTGPLWGAGELRSSGAVREIEQAIADAEPDLARGLQAADLRHERRALRLPIRALEADWEDAQTLRLAFELPSGAFATTVLRELCDWISAESARD